MRLFRAMETSTSALTAERLRMDIIANNLANINTTRTASGEPFRRKFAIQAERSDAFADILARKLDQAPAADSGEGVRIVSAEEDQTPYKLRHDPSHPDADENGMVRLPNVDLVQEMTDLMMAQRAYEANVSAFNAAKFMTQKALEIGR